MRIGVISDTHGLLRSEALQALEGSDHILHAGDVGKGPILEILARIAPVTAIRGNIDRHGNPSLLPATEAVELEGRLFYLVHNIGDLDLNPVAAHMNAIVSGHSHKGSIVWDAGVLYLNPGSAGPRRFKLPITVASVNVREDKFEAHLIEL